MLVFPASMHPQALIQNRGEPMSFSCDICGTSENGTKIQPNDADREPWAILPDEWTEVEDIREFAPKQFMIVCPSGDCRHEAESRTA